MLTTDESELVIKNCVAFNLLPEKRQSASERNKVSKFKKLLKTTSNDSIKILASLVLIIVKGQRSQTKDLEIQYAEEYRTIASDTSYCEMTTEDICVNLWRQSRYYLKEKKNICEDLYNQRVEYERIIKDKEDKINDYKYRINQLQTSNRDLNLKNDNLLDRRMKYDSDNESDEEEMNYDKMNDDTNLNEIINDLENQLEEANYQNKILKGQLETADIKCESEEEDTACEEAKQEFDNLAKANEASRLANRKKFGM